MKTIIKIFISISLIYTPFFAFAGAAEKWEIVEKVYDAASKTVEVTARKVGSTAANDPFYKARVPVVASELGSAARAGIFGVVAVAGVTAMLEGLGWIIDPANQSIYRNKPNPDQPYPDDQYDYQVPVIVTTKYGNLGGQYVRNVSAVPGIYKGFNGTILDNAGIKYIILSASVVQKNGRPYLHVVTEMDDGHRYNHYEGDLQINRRLSTLPNSPPPEKEYLSDDQLGNEILGEGENTSPMPAVITDIYDPNSPIPESAPKTKTGQALDSATPQPGTEPNGSTTPNPNSDTNGDGTPDTYDPAKPDAGSKFTLPNFCTWAPSVCDFFKVQKQDNIEIKENQKTDLAQNQSFFDEVKDWFTWSKENDDLPEDEKPQISEIPTPELKEDAIRWSAQCPADAQVPINMQGVSSTITFSWSPWCQLLDMIKPAIIASAYIGAAFIVLGLRT